MTKRPSIIIIEDQEDIREILRDFFETEGYFVETACNGAEGVELLSKAEKPSLILLDLMMPVMDGFEFIDYMKINDPRNLIPIVVMSADNQAGKKALALGVEHFLKKPLGLDQLMDVIETCTR